MNKLFRQGRLFQQNKSFHQKKSFHLKNLFRLNNGCFFRGINNQITRVVCAGIGLSIVPIAIGSGIYLNKKIFSDDTDTKRQIHCDNTIIKKSEPKYFESKYFEIDHYPDIIDKMGGTLYPLILYAQWKSLHWFFKKIYSDLKTDFQSIRTHFNIMKTTPECCIVIRKTSRLSLQIPAYLFFYIVLVPLVPIGILGINFIILDDRNFPNISQNQYHEENLLHAQNSWL